MSLDTIGKLRRLRLPLPPGIHQIRVAGVVGCAVHTFSIGRFWALTIITGPEVRGSEYRLQAA
jgi:hypothetical protein